MSCNIIYLSGNRSDYGLMEKYLRELNLMDNIDLGIGLVLNNNYKEDIKKAGLNIKVDKSFEPFDNQKESVAYILEEWLGWFKDNPVDIVIVMGDRWEIVPAVCAASYSENITILHFSGGETTLGSMDNFYRDRISEFSDYHFVAMDNYKNKLISMGIDESKIFVVGEVGLWDIDTMSFDELVGDLDFNLEKNNYVILSLHPEYPMPEEQVIEDFVEQVSDLPYQIISSAPATETGAELIKKIYNKYKNRIIYKEHFGRRRYLSLMKYSNLVIGNSSSGIVEAPSLEVPSINVGRRQEGRIKAKSVFDIKWDENLKNKVEYVLSFKDKLDYTNPYFKDNGFSVALEKTQWIVKNLK